MSVDNLTRPIHDTFYDLESSIFLQLKGEMKYIPVWVGRPGIGKSSMIKQMADKMDMHLYYVTGAKPLEFWTGLPITNILSLDGKDESSAYTLWTCPEIIHKANELAKTKNVLLFLDDMQVLDRACQRHFFEFVLERKLHGHKLAANVAIVAAANNSAESGNEGFYAAINNRFQWLGVHMDFDYWYNHVGFGLHPLLAGFLSKNREFLEEDESTTSPFATYRSWTEFSSLFTKRIEHAVSTEPQDIAYNLALGFVSPAASQALKNHIIIQSKFDFTKILDTGDFGKIDMREGINQVIFANVVRYIDLSNTTHVENFIHILKTKAKDPIFNNLVSSCVMELRHMKAYTTSNSLTKKSEKINAILNELIQSKEILHALKPVVISSLVTGAGNEVIVDE